MTDIVRDILKEVEEEAIQKGLEKGIQQGIQQGQQKQAIQTAKKMLSKGFSDDEIVELTGLSKQEIERVKRERSTN